MPGPTRAISSLQMAHSTTGNLRKLVQALPPELNTNALKALVQVAIAAYKAGLSVSANLVRGGFDTHSNHGATHMTPLADLLSGIDFAVKEATKQGVIDQVNIVVGSDFGRTPGYNSGQGKDHWAITSMMFMLAQTPCNRVIGATDTEQRALAVNPSSLATDAAGVLLTPAHIHRALEKKIGINMQAPELKNHQLVVPELPLFG